MTEGTCSTCEASHHRIEKNQRTDGANRRTRIALPGADFIIRAPAAPKNPDVCSPLLRFKTNPHQPNQSSKLLDNCETRCSHASVSKRFLTQIKNSYRLYQRIS